MSIAERLAEGPPRTTRVQCRLCLALDGMDPDDAEAVQAAAQANSGWTDRALVDLLAGEGHEVGRHSVAYHRQQGHRVDC
ncbi:MAG TPA: hypothetical protein VIG24_18225 [Acidimicrobiia bacterium]